MPQPKNIRPLARKVPNGAHISSPGVTQEPAKPSLQVVDQFRRYADTPAFGFDVLNVTVNGVQVLIYRACNFVQLPNGVAARAIPLEGCFLCFSEAEADAFQRKMKADALKPKLVMPGHPDFKPPQLH